MIQIGDRVFVKKVPYLPAKVVAFTGIVLEVANEGMGDNTVLLIGCDDGVAIIWVQLKYAKFEDRPCVEELLTHKSKRVRKLADVQV